MGTNWAPLPGGLNVPARRLIEELRTLKDGSGLSLAQISARTHYSRASWERWFNGKRLIPREALAALAAVIDFDRGQLHDFLSEAERETRVSSVARPGGSREVNGYPGAVPAHHPAARIAQLPAGIGDFTGRQSQIRVLTASLAGIRHGPGQVPVAVVCGGAGVGKTALATHVAHLMVSRFPDGNLYADLGGTRPTPRDPGDVLADWLHALGDRTEYLPASTEARSARFRSLTRDRWFLLLLDDAYTAAQVVPLLPAAETCAVLITSRRRLSDLAGAQRLEVGELPGPEALTLLEGLAGPARLAGEPQATRAVMDYCAGLPLALRIAGTRLGARPAWRVQTIAARLADPRRLLDELSVGDLAARASFEASYALLPDAAPVSAKRAFRLLGLAPGPDIGLPAAAALLDTSRDHSERTLETLVDVHLLETPAPGRYRFHDLIRLYAAERADEEEPAAGRSAALQRLLAWHAATEDAADQPT